MQLVPFNNDWADSGSKLDLKGVYQSTKPGDDRICNNLPIRRHNDWARKGLKYVTLASLEDVGQVVGYLRSLNISPTKVQESYELSGSMPFKVQEYILQQPQREAAEEVSLKARLAQIEAKKPTAATAYMGMDVGDGESVTVAVPVVAVKKRGRPRKMHTTATPTA